MGNKKVGTPTVSGMKASMWDYGIGLGGGLGYSLITNLTGSGLLGGLLSAAIVGSAVKGERGTVLATVLGFTSIVNSTGQAQAAPASSGNEATL